MLVQETTTDQFRVWEGQPLIIDGAVVSAPSAIDGAWTDAELAAAKLYRPVMFVVQAGKVKIGEPTYARVDEQIIETYEVADAPPPKPDDVRVNNIMNEPTVQLFLNNLSTMTGAQIDSWLAANVTSLAQARDALGYVIKAMVVYMRRHR